MEWVLLAVLATAVLVFVLSRAFKQQGGLTIPGGRGPGAVDGDGGADHRILLNMVLGDREKAERLIDYERRRDPGAGSFAIDRERD